MITGAYTMKSIEIYWIHWGYIGDSSASHLWLCQDSALSLVYPWNWRTHLSAFKDFGTFPPVRSPICFCPFPMILVVHVHKFWVVGCCRLITIPIEQGGQPLSLPSVQFPLGTLHGCPRRSRRHLAREVHEPANMVQNPMALSSFSS